MYRQGYSEAYYNAANQEKRLVDYSTTELIGYYLENYKLDEVIDVIRSDARQSRIPYINSVVCEQTIEALYFRR